MLKSLKDWIISNEKLHRKFLYPSKQKSIKAFLCWVQFEVMCVIKKILKRKGRSVVSAIFIYRVAAGNIINTTHIYTFLSGCSIWWYRLHGIQAGFHLRQGAVCWVARICWNSSWQRTEIHHHPGTLYSCFINSSLLGLNEVGQY